MPKTKKGKSSKKTKSKVVKKPFVSICTPTYNRRPFIPSLIKCFENQNYPKDKMEWIVIDDGIDKVRDLFEKVPQVKYFAYDEKIKLGKKRNLMHSKCKGDIIIYMDDDDYYPPNRVYNAVQSLNLNKRALCAGSSVIYIYFKHIDKIIQFGPYGPRHATAGTFAFRKELLEQTSYEDDADMAEERHFLKDYTIPFTQLDAKSTILVFSHSYNTFDKKKLLNPNNKFLHETDKTLDDFIKESEQKEFYTDKLESILKEYKDSVDFNVTDSSDNDISREFVNIDLTDVK